MAKKTLFTPAVLKTKEELLVALKKGDIKTSKYHMLDEDEKLFIELHLFGGYKPSKAMATVRPHLNDPGAAARRLLAKDHIVDVLEELTYKRDKMWLSTVSSARDEALNTMQFIMKTTDDDNLKAACATKIIDAADKAFKTNKKPEETVSGITFNIEYAPNVTHVGGDYNSNDEVIIQGDVSASSGMPYGLSYAEQIKASYAPKEEQVIIDAEVTEDGE